jgi:hypothetical protein
VCMGRTGSEDTFIHIISTRSTAQLLATLNYFQQHYGQEFEKALKKERWGELEGALQVAVQCFRQPAKFYAEVHQTCVNCPEKFDSMFGGCLIYINVNTS